MLTWYPDTCSGCSFELTEGDWDKPKRVISLCPHHQSVKDNNTLTDDQIFKTIIQSNRVREYARYAAKMALGLDKETGFVPYRVDADGGFTIGLDTTGTKLSGWPVSGKAKTDLVQAVTDAIANIPKPTGTSVVRIA